MLFMARNLIVGGGLPVPPGMDRRYRDSFQAMLRLIGMLYRAGIRVEAGTDAFAGSALHRELELDVAAGIPTTDVLQLATLGAARIMKHDADRGTVAPGKLADLIVVNGDPIRAISDIRKTEIVVKDGTVYRAADLYRAMGVRP
jgi:imidazolonepropionase-like amidohydrolase